ncbi:putative holin-like toxin [Lacrimispora sp.]
MEQSCHCKGVGLPSLHRWEVVLMKFDFEDLMAFGMFIIALLTFIFYNCK